MKLILPVVLLLLGLGSGIGAGVVLKPEPLKQAAADDETKDPSETEESEVHQDDDAHEGQSEYETDAEYVQLNNQFVVPVVREDSVDALVVLSLGVELDPGAAEAVYKHEPKLRDSMLQVLFDHANMGGFRGRFTDGNKLDVLRLSLTEVAQAVVGDVVRGVMITDIARQDI